MDKKQIPIDDGITIGSQPTTQEIEQLATEGFRAVVNLRVQDEDDTQIPPHEEGALVREQNMEYVHIPISTKQILHDQVATFRQAMENLERPIFVHCGSAKRAAALVFLDEAIRHGWSGQETLEKAHQLGLEWDQPHLKQFVKDYVDAERQKAAT